MSESNRHDVTRLLREWRSGRDQAREELWPLVYDELHRLAASQMRRERGDHTLQATALVHEAFVRLVESDVSGESRAEFLGLAARAMRNILIDHARGKRRAKRGGGNPAVTLDEELAVGSGRSVDLIDLDRALSRLSENDPRMAKVVELRFFGGLTHEEIASLQDISVSTVRRDLQFARAWLASELAGDGDGS